MTYIQTFIFFEIITFREKIIIADKGTVLTDGEDKAECFNDYFVNITKTLDIET